MENGIDLKGIKEQVQEESAATHLHKKQTWTFSSSGWLFLYHFGVIQGLRDLLCQP
jgi:hypothetical protein